MLVHRFFLDCAYIQREVCRSVPADIWLGYQEAWGASEGGRHVLGVPRGGSGRKQGSGHGQDSRLYGLQEKGEPQSHKTLPNTWIEFPFSHPSEMYPIKWIVYE